jgi:hypothetical protein
MLKFARDTWNDFNNCFIIEASVYLPSTALTNNTGAGVIGNAICGLGGAGKGSQGAWLAVWHDNLTNPRLRMYNSSNNYVESSANFPLDTWVNIKVEHNSKLINTTMYFNGALVSNDNIVSFNDAPSTGKTYQIIRGSYTWPQAKTNAETRGGQLALVKTEEIWNEILKLKPIRGLYLGATDVQTEGVFRWLDGTLLTTESWTPWSPGEPNNDQQEDYLHTWSDGTKWNDIRGEWYVGTGYVIEYPNTINNFFVGGRDDNQLAPEFNYAWKGYISNFKLYSTAAQPCPPDPSVVSAVGSVRFIGLSAGTLNDTSSLVNIGNIEPYNNYSKTTNQNENITLSNYLKQNTTYLNNDQQLATVYWSDGESGGGGEMRRGVFWSVYDTVTNTFNWYLGTRKKNSTSTPSYTVVINSVATDTTNLTPINTIFLTSSKNDIYQNKSKHVIVHSTAYTPTVVIPTPTPTPTFAPSKFPQELLVELTRDPLRTFIYVTGGPLTDGDKLKLMSNWDAAKGRYVKTANTVTHDGAAYPVYQQVINNVYTNWVIRVTTNNYRTGYPTWVLETAETWSTRAGYGVAAIAQYRYQKFPSPTEDVWIPDIYMNDNSPRSINITVKQAVPGTPVPTPTTTATARTATPTPSKPPVTPSAAKPQLPLSIIINPPRTQQNLFDYESFDKLPARVRNITKHAAKRWEKYIKINTDVYTRIQNSLSFNGKPWNGLVLDNYFTDNLLQRNVFAVAGIMTKVMVTPSPTGNNSILGPKVGNITTSFLLGFDSTTLTSTVYTDDVFYTAITHELGHALGLVYAKSADLEYMLETDYPEAQKVYNTITQVKHTKIKLSGAHWSSWGWRVQEPPGSGNYVYYPQIGNEIMLPSLDKDMRITQLSIKALVDYGYEEVTPGAAEGTAIVVNPFTQGLGQQQEVNTANSASTVLKCGCGILPSRVPATLGTVCFTDSNNCVFVSNHQTSTDLQDTDIYYTEN